MIRQANEYLHRVGFPGCPSIVPGIQLTKFLVLLHDLH